MKDINKVLKKTIRLKKNVAKESLKNFEIILNNKKHRI